MNQTPFTSPANPLVVKRTEDLLAFVPLTIGFTPECSVVMLSFGEQGSPFQARVDLPEDESDVDELVATLLRPARKHCVSTVIFVIYDDDTLVADESAWSLREAFEEAGIQVMDAIRVHGARWFAMLPGRPAEAYAGVPYDISSHPFTVRGIVEGRVTHRSREELRSSIAADAEAVAETARELCRVTRLPVAQVRSLVETRQRERMTLTPTELARLARTLSTPASAEHACGWLDRNGAREAVDLWTDAVRRVPESHVATPAAILAMVAWLAGDGALAWCAVDRCRSADPAHSLAASVAALLESATSPESWSPAGTDPAA